VVRLKHLLTYFLVAVAQVALFWGCAKGNLPVSLASTSSASITVPLKDSHGKDLSPTQVNVLYYIGGAGAPVTGTAGTASASTGNSFSFNVGLPSGSSYGYVAVQINAVSNNQVIAVGATTLTGGTVPVTLGPVNKPVYEVNPLGVGQAFGFESDTTVSEGVSVAATTPGLDVECNKSSDGTGFELDNSLLTINSIAYMGNGNFVDYLQLPAASAFATSSSLSKGLVVKSGSTALAPGDVYCAKLSGTGYAWLQITSVSAAGPVFVFRVNTTLPYCGYEQTTADAAAIAAGSPTPTATVITAAVTVAASVSITGSTPPYDVAVFGPTNGAATTMFVPNSTAGTVGVYNLATLTNPSLLSTVSGLVTPVGLAVDPNGSYLYIASSGASIVNQYQITGSGLTLNTPGPVGGGAEVSVLPDTQAASGALDRPRYVAVDNTEDLFITDTGTGNVSDVMEFLSPVPLTSTTSVNYWNGSLNSTGGANSIGQVTTAGTTVIVANSTLGRIDFYSETETTGSSISPLYSLSSDNNPAGAVALSNPQGVAYSPATGLLYISDTANNRIVEMSLTGTFSRILSTGLGLSGPTGIKVDNAIPPNIYVADTGNSRVLILQ
jgi:sugar lactone lactonase YvrE